jgi:putative pyruvate formate lyase activating enzyme
MQTAAYTYLTDADWEQRIRELERIAGCCELCPRRCGVNRFEGERGFCTVFFTHCTLKCVFCQNYQISYEQEGQPFSVEELAQKMLGLQARGCHNINLVTATQKYKRDIL